jgi:hypothetical protein
VVSTAAGQYRNTADTAVPNQKVIESLEKVSDYFSIRPRSDKGDIKKVITIDLW